MCGIAGFCGRFAGSETIARMTSALTHRGPDAGGIWTDEAAAAALGHRRLAIVDLTDEGAQPMRSACGRFVLVFNGEIYNYREMRRELDDVKSRGAWRGESDTEVLLAAFAKWGVLKALERANGMFALALWDRARRTMTLARDRMGEKPLYYFEWGGALVFASELKALREHPAFDGEIDRDALGEYFRYGYVPSPRSIYRGVSKLAPASSLTWHAGRSRIETYWRIPDAAPQRMRDEEAVERVATALRESVRARMMGDVPLGAFLSGGIDSSAIVAVMGPLTKTFTIGFAERAYDESGFARAIARHIGTAHTEAIVTPREAMAAIPKLPEIYDEPFADSSQIPTFLVSQLARKSVAVALSGDGGDELFGGYSRYRRAELAWPVAGWLPRDMRLPGGDRLRKLADGCGAANEAEFYRDIASYWPRPEVLVDGYRAEPASLPCGPTFATRMMTHDMKSYLPDDLLVKLDRAAMAVSLEGRLPFLDPALIAVAQGLPLDMRREKRVLKLVLRKHFPAKMFDRPKVGFRIPLGDWLRGPLRDWAEGLLTGAAPPARKVWQELLSGRGQRPVKVWSVLMYEAWRRSARRLRQPSAAIARYPSPPEPVALRG